MTISDPGPVFGWAMNFTTGPPYQQQSNIIGGPSSPLYQQKRVLQCPSGQTDGLYSQRPPFYRLGPGPQSQRNCPFYNYTLPNVYPYSTFDDVPSPDPKLYWFYPYYRDERFWENPIVRVPKPGY